MIYPFYHLSYPSFFWPVDPYPFVYTLIDYFSYAPARVPYLYSSTSHLSLYWRLTDAAMNAEFWTNLNRSLSDSYYRMLMTASRPETIV